jgi:hypothetical protein
MKLRLFVLAVLLSMSIAESVGMAQTAGARGQQNRPAAAVPNRPAAATSLPRARDGKPDLSGFWQVMNTANFDIQDHSARDGVPAGQGVVEGNELPYLPAALAKKQENYKARATDDPETKCLAPGVPRLMYMPYPFQIVQDSGKVFMLFEYASHNRTIHTDGTPHPKGGLGLWLGDARGHWEGDTLVADVTDFNDQTWFDRAGNFHSDALHVVERYSLKDRDHMNYEATIEDPNVFTRPWKMKMIFYRRVEENFRVLEYLCWAFPLEKYYPYPTVPR